LRAPSASRLERKGAPNLRSCPTSRNTTMPGDAQTPWMPASVTSIHASVIDGTGRVLRRASA
jgi:hypothetical protein